MKRLLRIAAVVVALDSLSHAAGAAEPATGPARSMIAFEMAVYLPAAPEQDAVKIGTDLCRQFPHFVLPPEKPTDRPKRPTLRVRFPAIQEYAPPDERMLKHSGRGLSKEQVKQVTRARAAVAVGFFAPKPRAGAVDFKTVRTACEAMLAYARKSGGMLWDEETREVFSPEEWKKRRIDSWQKDGDVPRVLDHVTIHFYQPDDGELPRAITLGMAKFGCPDVVVNNVTRQHSASMGGLINLVCQTMAERGGGPAPGKSRLVDLDVDALKHKAYAESVKKTYADKATGKVRVTVAEAKREEGDPPNDLVELTFEGVPGGNIHERRVALIAALFGSKDEIAPVKADDPAMLAASARAKVKLPAKRKQFKAGLPVGDHFVVKAPFKTPDDSAEYMWVEVTAWADDGKVTGILASEPAFVPDLKAGAKVTVREADVYDYIHYHADGTMEGNETTKVIQEGRK